MRLGAAEFGPVALSALRVGIAALALLPLLLWHGQATALRANWRAIAIVGVVNSALPFVLFSVAALAINAGLSAIFNATAPLWGALIAWAWLGDRLSRTARGRPGHRLCRRRLAGVGQGQLQARRAWRQRGGGDRRLPGRDPVLRLRRQLCQAQARPGAAAGGGHRQPALGQRGTCAAGAVAVAGRSAEQHGLGQRRRPGAALHRRLPTCCTFA